MRYSQIWERRKTAIHEAGHALAAYCLGFDVVSATIKPRSGVLGQVDYLGRRRPFRDAVFAQAGQCAEFLCFAGDTARPDDYDSRDLAAARMELLALHGSDDEFLESADFTADLLRQNMRGLLALSAELLRRETLDGRDVERVLRRNGVCPMVAK